MRKLLLSLMLGSMLLCSTGCLIPIYSSNPQRRTEQLLNESEGMRLFQGEWERFWLIDQPSHLTHERVHGGIT